PRDEIAHESAGAGFSTGWRKWAGRSAVPGKIGDEHTQVVVRKLLCAEGHDLFVGGKTVQENDRADWRAGARLVNVCGHLAAASCGEHRVDFIGFTVGEVVALRAEQQAARGLQKAEALHRAVCRVRKAGWKRA